MPDPAAGNTLIEIVMGSGLVSILVQSYVGFKTNKQELRGVHKRLDDFDERNDAAHSRIEKAVDRTNGTGRDNTTAIARIEVLCKERHSPTEFRRVMDRKDK